MFYNKKVQNDLGRVQQLSVIQQRPIPGSIGLHKLLPGSNFFEKNSVFKGLTGSNCD